MSDIKSTGEDCITGFNAVGDALYVIGGKWRLRIIIVLFGGNKRFNELQKNVTGISAKVLSDELKTLELNGFVIRMVHNETPIAVEYKLTEYSKSLRKVVHALDEWGKTHREKIKNM